VLEAGALTIPLLAIFFIPVLIGMNDLYPWTHGHEITETKLQHKSEYLNVSFFIGRSVLYFILWSLLAWFLSSWSREFDRTGDPKYTRRLQILSGPGLVLFVLSVTFWSFDWLMSLEPEWYTTAYGFIMVSAQGLSAMAFAIVVMSWLEKHPPLSQSVTAGHFHDLGNLLLAFLMFWTYCAFSQYLIYWSGNIPEEVSWYVHRSQGGWIYFAYVLIFVHFVLPFLLLLSRRVKQRHTAMGLLALGILAVRAVDTYWLILPAFYHEGIALHWLDLVLPLALGALWILTFLSILKRRPLLPLAVPEFETSGHTPMMEST